MMCAACVPVCVCAEQPVHVADAGAGFLAVRPAARGDPAQASLPHLASRPAAGFTGPAGGERNSITQKPTKSELPVTETVKWDKYSRPYRHKLEAL